MSFEDEARAFHRGWGNPSVEVQMQNLEASIAAQAKDRDELLLLFAVGMERRREAGEDFYICEFPDPNDEDREGLLVIEEWLEASCYLFEFEEENREGKWVVTLTIYIGEG